MATAGDFELPAAKRKRLEGPTISAHPSGSRLFAPFRTVGLVSSPSVPFTSVPLGRTTFQITTSVGRGLQTYDLRKGLALVFLSQPQCPHPITATCAYRDRVFAAWGGQRSGVSRGIWVLKRGRPIAELSLGSSHEQDITQILVFGAWIIGCGSHTLEVWKNDSYEHYTTITPLSRQPQTVSAIVATPICTLPTFLNKIFVGAKDGSIEVYNVSTGKMVFVIQASSPTAGAVTALSAASSIGLLAVAYDSGDVRIIDAQAGHSILCLRPNSKHPVTCISFRSDGLGAGEDGKHDGVMATSSSRSGDITIWDLNRGGKVVGVLRGAHDIPNAGLGSGITKIEFLPGQPVIISTGTDNALRSWIFDQSPFSPVPRLLHSRSGHAAPVTSLQFLPAASDGSEAAGKWLMTAGQDRSLWAFSLRKDTQSTELSQGNVRSKAKKLGKLTDDANDTAGLKVPPIIDIACSLNRDGGMGAVGGPVWTNPKADNAEEAGMTGWESVVTAHQGDSFARTWFWGRKKAGRWAFETGDRKPVTRVAISACGTFALVGSAGGCLDMYNLQSGMHRQRFPPKLKPNQAKQLKTRQLTDGSGANIAVSQRHHDAITGIVVDSLNRTVISTSLDGTILYWDFNSGSILRKETFESGIPVALRYNSNSGLISMACDDLCIRVIDIETKRTVRELWGCVGQIYDHCFSHDGRWIVACSTDSVIRLFDLATGHLIDAFKTATCTSVAFSSTGEFLATAHAGQLGINIWNNKSLYTQVPFRPIDEDKGGIIDMTEATRFGSASQIADYDDIANDDVGNIQEHAASAAIDQLDSALLTLSLVPPSRWQTLLNLDSIRERNKPIQPPQKPKAAPFFLGSSASQQSNPTTTAVASLPLRGLDAFENQLPTTNKRPDTLSHNSDLSRINRLTSLAPQSSDLTTLLSNFTTTPTQPDPIITHLQHLAPSSTDLELRTLSLSEIPTFIRAMTARLRQRRDFELVNTWMSVVLRVHSEFVAGVDEVREAVVEFRAVMEEESRRLGDLVGWVRGVGEFLRSSR